MTKQTPAKPVATNAAYLVFGADDHAKPRAAVFAGIEVKLLEKAADGVNLRVVPVVGEDLIDLAKKLPVGRLHANGKGFVPYVRGDLYCDLVAATCGDQQPGDKGGSLPRPATWDAVKAGDLVVAQESHDCGWWEAVVVERQGDIAILKYRDFPKMPKFSRHRSVIALTGVSAPTAS